ncbi:MAG: glutamate synthase (ferredoxin), partial [Alphaproteobacteria bacterium]
MANPTLEEKLHAAREAAAHGLYSPAHEHDACGMGFVADIQGRKSHLVIQQAIQALENLSHRGACGCDPLTGDGAGITIQVPDKFLRRVCGERGIALPPAGRYAVGMLFLPRDEARAQRCVDIVERIVAEEGQTLLGWREVPVVPGECGPLARESLPRLRHVFVGAAAQVADQEAFERKLYVVRRRIEDTCMRAGLGGDNNFYVCSLSSRTLVYKGLLIAYQFARFFPDLGEADCESAIALVHSRFSTNTFPCWNRAHAPEPLHRAQRGDQHAARQRELDARASTAVPLRHVWQRHRETLAHHRRGRQRLGGLRQRAGTVDVHRAFVAARGDDDDPRGVAAPRDDERP